MITLRNLEKFYAHGVSKTFVLRQIRLEVKEGEGGFNRSMQQWPPVYQRGWQSRASCAVVC